MKVKELLHALTDEDPEAQVIISSDSEGNRFGELMELQGGRYVAADTTLGQPDVLPCDDGEDFSAILLIPGI